MKIMGTAINTFITILVVIYLFYIWGVQYQPPQLLADLYSNILFRISALLLIIFAIIGHKGTGVGGPVIGILLAVAYVVTMDVLGNKNMTEYLTMNEDEDY